MRLSWSSLVWLSGPRCYNRPTLVRSRRSGYLTCTQIIRGICSPPTNGRRTPRVRGDFQSTGHPAGPNELVRAFRSRMGQNSFDASSTYTSMATTTRHVLATSRWPPYPCNIPSLPGGCASLMTAQRSHIRETAARAQLLARSGKARNCLSARPERPSLVGSGTVRRRRSLTPSRTPAGWSSRTSPPDCRPPMRRGVPTERESRSRGNGSGSRAEELVPLRCIGAGRRRRPASAPWPYVRATRWTNSGHLADGRVSGPGEGGRLVTVTWEPRKAGRRARRWWSGSCSGATTWRRGGRTSTRARSSCRWRCGGCSARRTRCGGPGRQTWTWACRAPAGHGTPSPRSTGPAREVDGWPTSPYGGRSR